MKTYGGMEVELCAFLTATLDGDHWSGSRPGRFTQEKVPPLPIVQVLGWNPEPAKLSGGEQKSPAPVWYLAQSLRRLSYKLDVRYFGVQCHAEAKDFSVSTASRQALVLTQPQIQWFPLGQSGWGRQTDHSPPSCVEVKNAYSDCCTPPCVFMA
jgi:hypothetical protein